MLQSIGLYNPLITTSSSYPSLITSPYTYLRLNEVSGTTATAASGLNGTILGNPTFQTAGLLHNDSNKAYTFSSSSSSQIYTNAFITAPTIYTLECLFQTTSFGGLIGFGNNSNQVSSNSYDRELFMKSDGKLVVYVSGGGALTLDSPAAYNDGNPHIVTLVQHSGGIEMWVDKVLVASNANASAAAYSGYWHIGNCKGWGSAPGYFNGVIDEVSITHSRVSQAEIQARHAAARNL